jgi:hypothetical protein
MHKLAVYYSALRVMNCFNLFINNKLQEIVIFNRECYTTAARGITFLKQ